MKIDLYDPKELIFYEKNNKLHPKEQIDKIKKSIEEFGFNVPVIIDKDKVIIAGHGRVTAARQLGLKEIPTLTKDDLTEQQIRAYRITDNKTAESEWDIKFLNEELKDLLDSDYDETLTGFDLEEMENMFNKDKEEITEKDVIDILPDDIKKIKTDISMGDCFKLGEHLLVCGDSTDEKSYNIFENKINLCFSSPPYNMNAKLYDEYEDNIESKKYIDFNMKIIDNVQNKLNGFIFWNISYNKNSRIEFIKIMNKMIEKKGMEFLELIVWNKKTALPITSDRMLTRNYEDIIVIGNEEAVSEEINWYYLGCTDEKAAFNRKTNQGLNNYWEIVPNKIQIEGHNACFPVELPAKAIRIMTKVGDLVIDPFGGSGTTLIACEQMGRKCRMIEYSPEYCQVIINRWEKLTKLKAEKLMGDC